MTVKPRILFLAEAATRAHVVRPTVLAAALDRSEYEVCLATSTDFRSHVEAAGLPVRDLYCIGTRTYLAAVLASRLLISDLKRQVREPFRRHGLPLSGDRTLPRRAYTALARALAQVAPRDLRKALAALPIYLDYLADSQAFDDTAFHGWLVSLGVARPAPSTCLATLPAQYLSQRYGSSAGATP